MQIRRPRAVIDTVINSSARRRQKIQFLQKKCCEEQCNLDFIKENCPRTRKNGRKKNTEVVTNMTTTTPLPPSPPSSPSTPPSPTSSSPPSPSTPPPSSSSSTTEIDYSFMFGAPPEW
uniref:Insulin-like domain-containing protein n=1 Tax=Schizaphis graminum TaxID=13262 RepID=A0A2S2PPZ2_SCHGA